MFALSTKLDKENGIRKTTWDIAVYQSANGNKIPIDLGWKEGKLRSLLSGKPLFFISLLQGGATAPLRSADLLALSVPAL